MTSPGNTHGRYWLLDAVAGWREASRDGLHGLQLTSPDGHLILDPLPGTASLLLDADTQASEFKSPSALSADDSGKVLVTDAATNLVKRVDLERGSVETLPAIGGRGSEPRELREPHGIAALQSPTRLAAGPDDRIAVVDVGSDAVLVTGSGTWHALPGVDKPRSVTFGAGGTIYVGGCSGLIHVFVPDIPAPSGYRNAGTGVTGLDGEIVDLIWHHAHGLIAIVQESSNGQRRRLWQVDPAGARARTGTFTTRTLDSKIDPECQWHRVLLDAKVPAGTSIQIDSFAFSGPRPDGEVVDSSQWNPDDKEVASGQWRLCVRSGNHNPDCLIQSGPGRYLQLRLTFSSDGIKSPELRSLKVFYPRVTYLQYLPAVYQEDEESRLFLERFLSIFQSEFDDLDHRIDQLWQVFNPDSTRAEHLPWLAAWFALVVNPDWPESKLRSMLKGAFTTYLMRGTVDGLKQAIRDYAGVEANIVEGFRLRRLPVLSSTDSLLGGVRLWSADFYRRLQVGTYSQIGSFRLLSHPEPNVEALAWGANQFTVCFLANPYESEDIQRRITQVVEREKPAHTQATICPIFPRFRIGVQATIGADTVVGGINYLVLNRLASLGYDSVLGSSREEAKLRGLGSTPRPAVGRSSRLL